MATRNPTLLGEYAGFVTRAAALIVDIVIIIAVVLVVEVVVALPLVFFLRVDLQTCVQDPASYRGLDALFCRGLGWVWLLVGLLTAPIYFIFFFTVSGQTIGKYVMGVRIVRADGRPMTVKTSFVRWVGYFVSLIPLGLGFFWVTVDPRRLGFHDHLARTCVVYSWRAFGNDYFLERVGVWFARHRPSTPAPAAAPLVDQPRNYDLIALAVPSLSQAQELLSLLNNLVTKGTIVIELTAVLAKDADGKIGIVSFTDLALGPSLTRSIRAHSQLVSGQQEAIARDLPTDSFIVVVLLLEHWADELVKQVSRQASVVVRRYDLGTDPDGTPPTPGAAAPPTSLPGTPLTPVGQPVAAGATLTPQPSSLAPANGPDAAAGG